MTKQLITIIGALATAVVLVLAVLFGVTPLVTSGFSAMAQTAQEESVNEGYRSQVENLKKEEQRMAEIENSVAGLREQIPSDPLLDEPFGIIAESAQRNNLSVESITRGDLAAFTPRLAPSVSGPATNATGDAPAAAPTDPAPATPVDAAQDAAAGAEAQTDATNAGSAGAAPTAPTAPAAPDGISMNGSLTGELQIPVEVTATATDASDIIAFLDGLRGQGRVIAIDKVVVSGNAGELAVTVSAFVFVSTDGAS